MINFAKGCSISHILTLPKVVARQAIINFGKVCDWQSSYGKIVNKYTKRRELTICHYIHLLICYFADWQIKRKPPTYSALADSPEGGRLQNALT